MIGFVCAISSSLAVIILITISSLLGYLNSILPSTGFKKINETHYQYITGNVFLGGDAMVKLTIGIDDLEKNNNMILLSHRTVCNYGFNRSEREMAEIVTFNFLKIKQYYREDPRVLNAKTENHDSGINYCYVDINFNSASKINNKNY
jgi:hypothetical protein